MSFTTRQQKAEPDHSYDAFGIETRVSNESPKSPLKSRSVAELAADQIKKDICNGQLQGGERLREISLAKGLGVSRGTLREALVKLGGTGLVQSTPRRGWKVSPVENKDLDSAFRILLSLLPGMIDNLDKPRYRALVSSNTINTTLDICVSSTHGKLSHFYQEVAELTDSNLLRQSLTPSLFVLQRHKVKVKNFDPSKSQNLLSMVREFIEKSTRLNGEELRKVITSMLLIHKEFVLEPSNDSASII